VSNQHGLSTKSTIRLLLRLCKRADQEEQCSALCGTRKKDMALQVARTVVYQKPGTGVLLL
jgi:hypothetical protein